MGDQSNNRKRNTYLLIIAAVVFVLLEQNVGMTALISLLLIFLGIRSIQSGTQKKGYILLGIGTIILLGDNLGFIVLVVLISLGLFYYRSKRLHRDETFLHKRSLIESLKWNKQAWSLQNMSLWNVIGEINMDLSLAMMEEKETTLILQGIIGDIDIIVPEDVGVSVSSSVFFGQIDVGREKEAGILNKIVWQSPNYMTSSCKVKLIVSYIVADIDVKMI